MPAPDLEGASAQNSKWTYKQGNVVFHGHTAVKHVSTWMHMGLAPSPNPSSGNIGSMKKIKIKKDDDGWRQCASHQVLGTTTVEQVNNGSSMERTLVFLSTHSKQDKVGLLRFCFFLG
jgi:hypothetical protein